MPITTYLNGPEHPLTNPHVIEWLENARKFTGQKIVVHEYRFDFKRWFRKQTNYRYSIYWPVGNGIEHQVINFMRDGTDWSINTLIPAEMAVAYLMGICTTRNLL